MRVGEFEKVSFEQFYDGVRKNPYGAYSDEELREAYDNLKLPTRATSGSAGYDFKSPLEFRLCPGSSVVIPTGIRCKIDDGWFLACFPRSGLGFKYKARLANGTAIVDADYAHADNEGHIFLKVCNEGHKEFKIEAGSRFAQGVLLPFGLTYSDNAEGVRFGGFGSTG